MSEAGLIAVVVAVLGVVGGGGFWGYRQFSKEAPVRQRDATIAAADKSVQMALAVAVAAREDSGSLREDLNTERVARQNLSTRVEALETQLREQNKLLRAAQRVIRILDEAWDDLAERWAYHRLQDQPPPRPNTTENSTQAT